MTTELAVDKEQALSVPEQAKAFTITSNDEYLRGEDFLATCKALENQVHADLDDVVKAAHTSWKSSVALRDKYLTPLEDGRKIVKGKMIIFQQEQERIRQEEQRRAEVEAKARAEQEALEAALAAEKEGDTETAEAIISEPVQVAPVFVPKTAPAASRLSAGRIIWIGEVTNLMALVKAVADGKQPLSYLEASKTVLGVAARMKSSCNIPGVVAKSRMV